MAADEYPNINDFLSRLYTVRDESASRAAEQGKALLARHSAKGLLRSGASLTGLAAVIEKEFEVALSETLETLRRMKSVPGVDYGACRDQAFLRIRDLIPALRAATGLDRWLDTIGRGSAAVAINARIDALAEKIDYRFRQFDVGLDRTTDTLGEVMTPTATRLEQRLRDRRAWFQNDWFVRWHRIGGDQPVEIDQFNGRYANYAGISFDGSARDVYWQSIAQGLRKEIIEQFGWVEDSVRSYDRSVASVAIDQCAGLITSFARGLRREAVAKDRLLRGNGTDFPAEQDMGHWDGTSDVEVLGQAEALKSALFPPTAAAQASSQRASPTPKATREARPYQVALSFAGEQRDYVQEVAKALAARHVAVFYDEFQSNELWGKDGAELFHQVYARDAQYVVMFISKEYVEKAWTRLERRSALSRQMKNAAEYILPVRFDDSEVAGLPDTIQYLTATRYTPAELAVEIARKLGVGPTAGKASDMPPPASGTPSGEVTFNYGAHNGRFVIGSGVTSFETAWSKASDTSIHLMNDPPSIHGVAIARGATDIDQIEDASAYDFSSRSRTVKTGEVAVLQNTEGFYAAVKVVRVQDDSRGAPSDALTISYVTLPDGGRDFRRACNG